MTRALKYMTYAHAKDWVLEPTELGYTQKSKDRLWLVVCFDDWSEGEYAELRGSLIYAQAVASSYELWEDELVFLSRWTAEKFARDRNATTNQWRREHGVEEEDEIWMVANLGDLDRFEHAWLDRGEVLRKGKYRGSDAVLNKRADHWIAYLNKEHA